MTNEKKSVKSDYERQHFNQVFKASVLAHEVVSSGSPWTCEPVLMIWLMGLQEDGPKHPMLFRIKDLRGRFIGEFGGRFKESVVNKAFAGLCEKNILDCIKRGEYMFNICYIFKGDSDDRKERLNKKTNDRSKKLRGIPNKVDSEQREA